MAGCTGGYIPYKDFKGGEDHAGGQAGVKIACRTDGHMSVHMHSNNVPIMTLYESKQPALRINEPAYAAATPKQVKPISANQPTFQSQELMHAEQKSFSYSTPQTVLPGPIEAAGFSYQNPSYQFYTPLALQQSAAQSTPHKAKTANKAPVPNGGWSSTHEHIMGGHQNPLLALGGPRFPVNISAEWLSSLGPMREGRIPVAKLPGLVWDALGESGKELFDGTISLVKFTASEIKRDIKGEPLETTKAIALMGRFVSEEVARFVLNKDLETKKIIESMAAEFDNLSKEEKFKAGIKLYVSLVAVPIASVKGAQAANKAGKKMLEAVKKPKVVEAPPAPKALLFSKPVAWVNPPAVPLVTKATNVSYINIASGVTKAEARNLLQSNIFDLTMSQIKTIKDCLGKGAVDRVYIKKNELGLVRLSLERKGHTSGFQRMSYEIDSIGNKSKVVQTAFDSNFKLVHQKPGAIKNNLYDVKKMEKKNAKN